MKKNVSLTMLYVLLILFMSTTYGCIIMKASSPSSDKIIFLNNMEKYCILTSGEVDSKNHIFKLEYYPLDNKRKYSVNVVEAINEYTDIKVIGTFSINLDIQGQFGKATFSNANLTKGKKLIIWVSEKPINNLSSNEKKSILERAKAVLAEQYRLAYIGAYKSVDEMANEIGKNYEE